jgi:aldehyde dehydrogenase (NAD+)
MLIGKNYIDGKWHKNISHPDKLFASTNPATGEVVGHFPETDAATVFHAVAVARSKQKAWRSLSRIARAEYFLKLADVMAKRFDEIVKAISLETGKNLNESIAEVNEALHMTQYTFAQGREQIGKIVASEIAAKDVFIFRKPKGVVGVISPWNFPFAIGGFWTSAPALLEGNTVVFKPSEETPYVGQIIAELYHEAGFPPGVFNLVQGCGQVAGRALVEAEIDHVCFTGSAEVSHIIRDICNQSWHKSCSCETGSKSAVIVFDDANMDLAVKACITSAFKLSGQRCVSAGRILVQRTILDKFTELFVDAAKKLTVGDPFAAETPDYGPLINEAQTKKVLHYNQLTIKNAAADEKANCYSGAVKINTKILLEGKQVSDRCLTPHVYMAEWTPKGEWHDEKPSNVYLREEVFGPHVAIIPFDTPEDAVNIYNDTQYGLSMATITNNMHIARYMRDNCEFGLGYLNLPSIGAESHIPFGGIRGSGYGGSSAAGSFKAVTHEVSWTANYDQEGFQMAQGLK